jgi:hypothetical protein
MSKFNPEESTLDMELPVLQEALRNVARLTQEFTNLAKSLDSSKAINETAKDLAFTEEALSRAESAVKEALGFRKNCTLVLAFENNVIMPTGTTGTGA